MTLSKAEHDYIEQVLAKGMECSFGKIPIPNDTRVPCHKRAEEFMMFHHGDVIAYCREHYEGLINVLKAVKKKGEE